MRVIALLQDHALEFSLGGTIGILFTFTAMAAALGMTYALLSRRFRRGPEPQWWALAGLGLFAVVLFVTPLRREIGLGPNFVALFLPVALLLGCLPAWLGRALALRLPEGSGSLRSAGYVVLSIPGWLSLVVLPLLIVFGILQTAGVIPVPPN
jgi:hypothetical protein